MVIVNTGDEEGALRHMPGADAFCGKITPRLLALAPGRRWVQTPTARLEYYLFPELVSQQRRFCSDRVHPTVWCQRVTPNHPQQQTRPALACLCPQARAGGAT